MAGAVLTGGIGLLAGTIGSNRIKITCINCGHVFSAGDAKKKADRDRFNNDLYEGKSGTVISVLVVAAVFVIVFYLFIKACSGTSPSTKNFVSSAVDSSGEQKQPEILKSTLKYDLLYPGEWILSSQFPDDVNYSKLTDIYSKDDIFGSSGDYIHAKKGKNFQNDHKFILAANENNNRWKYFVVDIYKGTVKVIHPKVTEITSPDLSSFDH